LRQRGGYFTNADTLSVNNIASWNGLEWHTVGTNEGVTANALVNYKGKLYIAGGVVQDSIFYYASFWDGIKWNDMGLGYMNGETYAIDILRDTLYLAGNFIYAGGDSVNCITLLDLNSIPTSFVSYPKNIFNVSPNPAFSYINIVYSTEHNATLTINAYGIAVKQLTLYPYFKNRIVYVDDLAEGIYLVTMWEGDRVSSGKMIVQR